MNPTNFRIFNLYAVPYKLVQTRNFNCHLNVLNRQKISYKTKYEWMLGLKKSRMRARYPWIPREPELTFKFDEQTLKLPEANLEFIVPSGLEECKLKPYVEWKSVIKGENELTADELFEKRYRSQIIKMYKRGKSKDMIMQAVNEKLT